jgi:2,5-diketo-D-gluconate reductase A
MSSPPSSPFEKASWRIGLGTYRLGAETENVVSQALTMGWRHIDTAALYRNEAAVGAAIRASGIPRHELFVTTKIHVDDIARLQIPEAVERALAHLGEIDLMLLHGWRSQAPEAWAMLAEQANKGRVRLIGVSNFGADDLLRLAPPAPAVNQIEMSPFLQRRALRKVMSESGITTVAHSPLAKAQRMSAVATAMAGICDQRHGTLTAAQALLSWSMARGAVPLPRSGDGIHLRENLSALDIELSPDQLARLDALEDGFSTHPRSVRD